jgi:hypothetical protein
MATTRTKPVSALINEWRYCGCSDADIIKWAKQERFCTPVETDANRIARAVLAFFKVAA